MRFPHLIISFCALAVAGIWPSFVSAQGPHSELTDTEFRRLQRLLQPAEDEAWRTIPWKISVLDAQQTAAEQRKPIFIWAMDGHPLGCT